MHLKKSSFSTAMAKGVVEVEIFTTKSVEKLPKNHQNDNVCLLIWFKTGYFLCMCPFHVETLDTGQYRVRKHFLQKLLCALSLGSSVWMYISELKPVTDCIWVGNKNPADFLNLFFKCASIAHQMTFIYTMWAKVDCFSEIFNILAAKYSGKNICPSKWILNLACHFFFGMVVVSLMAGRYTTPISHVPTCTGVGIPLMPLGLHRSIISANFFSWPSESGSSYQEILLTLLFKLMSLCRRLMGHGKDAFIFMSCLTLWFPARAFAQKVLKSSNGLTQEILNDYETLKELSDRINEAISPLFFIFMTEAILFYAVSFKYVLVLSPTGLSVVVYFLTFFVCFSLAADVCKQVDSMRKLLSCPKLLQEELPRSNSSTITSLFLLNELQTYPVGLSANGMFVVNYTLTASICGSLMTYFIVTVQFDH